jgi:hypothetical protein
VSPSAFGIVLALILVQCAPREGAAPNPGNPTPAADPGTGPATASPPRGTPESDGVGGVPEPGAVPVRPQQAPLVTIGEALSADSLLGRRVRVAGRCTGAGAGRRAGSWTLEDEGKAIEVRGLVPASCGPGSTVGLTIFAQIEPKAVDSRERLLLRLPD